MVNEKEKIKLLLLPGFDGTGILFDPFLKKCSSDYLPIVIKYPESEVLSYKALEKIVMSKIPVDEKYLIVGESFSGPLSLRISALNPSNLLGVILVASFISSPVPTWLKILPFDYLSKIPIPFFILQHWLLDDTKSSELSSMLKEAVKRIKSNVIASRVRSILNVDESDSLKKITAPILYLRASKDRLVKKASYKIIKKTKPDVEIAELDGPHLLLQSQPLKAWQAIESFKNRSCDL